MFNARNACSSSIQREKSSCPFCCANGIVCCTMDSMITEVKNNCNTCKGLLHSFVSSIGPVDVDMKRGSVTAFVRVSLDLISSYFQVILLQQSLKNR